MYIRTKDGRIVDTTKIVTGSKYMDFATNDESFREIFKTEPLVKADTIEELCEQIVYNGYLYQNKITWDGSLVEDSFEELEEPITDEMIKDGIYGAIWTSKGLIYVAKMNDKGDFELI